MTPSSAKRRLSGMVFAALLLSLLPVSAVAQQVPTIRSAPRGTGRCLLAWDFSRQVGAVGPRIRDPSGRSDNHRGDEHQADANHTITGLRNGVTYRFRIRHQEYPVLWSGVSRFCPDQPATSAQMATFLNRASA